MFEPQPRIMAQKHGEMQRFLETLVQNCETCGTQDSYDSEVHAAIPRKCPRKTHETFERAIVAFTALALDCPNTFTIAWSKEQRKEEMPVLCAGIAECARKEREVINTKMRQIW